MCCIDVCVSETTTLNNLANWLLSNSHVATATHLTCRSFHVKTSEKHHLVFLFSQSETSQFRGAVCFWFVCDSRKTTPLIISFSKGRVILFMFRKQSLERTRADWLKIVFVKLDGDTELARAVDVVMT